MKRKLALIAWGLASGLMTGAQLHAEEPPLFNTGDILFDTITIEPDPFYPTSAGPVRLVVSGEEGPILFGCPYYNWNPPRVGPGTIIFDLDSFACPSSSAQPASTYPRTTRVWDLGLVPAGIYDVWVITDGYTPFKLVETRIEIHSPSPSLQLRDGFHVSIARPGEASELGVVAMPMSVESGAFAFFTPSNVEVTVKILDGRAINGHYWVFIASMTDQPFVATVMQNLNRCFEVPTDPKLSCPWRSYVAVAGQNRNFIDVEFPVDVPPSPDAPSAN